VPAPRVVEKVVERIVVISADARQRLSDALGGPRLPCPRCANALVEGRSGPHLLRGCKTCGGVFLEPAAVAELERTRDEGILRAVVRFMPIRMPFAPSLRTALSCPVCKSALVRQDLGETGHSMDSCESHGTFFDRGEVVAFADLCQERRAGDVSAEDLENAGIPRGLSWWKR
jgi:Zn-finger nucleic acid-binding protein